MGNVIGSPTVKCFRFVCGNLTTFPFGKRIVGKLDSWAFWRYSHFQDQCWGLWEITKKVTIARRLSGRNMHIRKWTPRRTAHRTRPELRFAYTHADHSPPRGRHPQRRGPVPKLLWVDLFDLFWQRIEPSDGFWSLRRINITISQAVFVWLYSDGLALMRLARLVSTWLRTTGKMMVQLPLPPVPPPPRSTVVPSAPSKNPFDDDDDIDDLSPQHPLHSPTNARSSLGPGRPRHRLAAGGSGSSPEGSPTEPSAGPCRRCSDCCFKCTARCTRVLLVGPNLLFLVSKLRRFCAYMTSR